MSKNDLREQIKSQIKDNLSSKLSTDSSDTLDEIFNLEVARKKIFLEERDSFYQAQKGFIKILNEIGEEEWVREVDLKKREGYFNFEDDLEDADSHKHKVIRQLFMYLTIVMLLVAGGFYYLSESAGYIEVNCNVKNIPIFLDGYPTGLSTDNVIENVKTGKHKISLQPSGYKITPSVIDIDLKHNEGLTVSFTADSLKVIKKDSISASAPVIISTAKQ